MWHYARLTCVLAFCAVAVSAQTIPAGPVLTTGMIGIAASQTAQLNLLNPGVQPPATGVICSVVAAFVDKTGTVVKTSPIWNVLPGTSQSFAIHSDTDLNVIVAGDRREVRATIVFPPVASATGASSTATTRIKQSLFHLR